MTYAIEGLTLAVTNMNEMLAYYKALFQIDFKAQEMHGFKLYQGQWGDMKLLFCPAALAQNTAQQNRHQFDIQIDDLEQVIEAAENHGGKLMSAPQEQAGIRSVGILDPDNNSLVFKQPL